MTSGGSKQVVVVNEVENEVVVNDKGGNGSIAIFKGLAVPPSLVAEAPLLLWSDPNSSLEREKLTWCRFHNDRDRENRTRCKEEVTKVTAQSRPGIKGL